MYRVTVPSTQWLLCVGACLAACSNSTDRVTGPEVQFAAAATKGPVPGPLAQFAVGGSTVELFPYLADDLSSNGRDPVNLVFAGAADPRAIRVDRV